MVDPVVRSGNGSGWTSLRTVLGDKRMTIFGNARTSLPKGIRTRKAFYLCVQYVVLEDTRNKLFRVVEVEERHLQGCRRKSVNGA